MRQAWELASARCAQWGGALASVRRQEEDALVQQLSAGQAVWIGLKRVGGWGELQWVDSGGWGYFNWAVGEPDGR
eukprot:1484387-Rhodomonas_salina.1